MNNELKELKIIKNDKKVTNEELSRISGVPLGTVNKILSGATKSVKVETIQKLRFSLDLVDKNDINFENHGFYKVSACTPKITLASPSENASEIINSIINASKQGVHIITFPKLSLSGATVGDLFFQTELINACENAILKILTETQNLSVISVIGAPLKINSKLFSVGVIILKGKILGIVPEAKPDARYFSTFTGVETIEFLGAPVPFGNFLFECENLKDLKFKVEFSSSLFSVNKSESFTAPITLTLSSIIETVGKNEVIKNLLITKSRLENTAIVYAESGYGESTTDFVFSASNFILERGKLLSCSKPFSNETIVSDVDAEFLINESAKEVCSYNSIINRVKFSFNPTKFYLTRSFRKTPFVPDNSKERTERAELILNIQANGLKRRLEHTRAKKIIIGVSGGLDSTLALLVAIRSVKLTNLSANDIIAITMPCFGTTSRTKNNAVELSKLLGVSVEEINIKNAVTQHFEDINHDANVHDVTFENSQARERTQVLLDYANKVGGLVVGTGDLSELCLGWATFNGDHISNYGVNGSIPKTLIRHLVSYEANRLGGNIKSVLFDVLDTPVSPELVPPKDGEITQKTEDLVGPYVLHDFYIYYALRKGYKPSKIFYIAKQTFKNEFTPEVLYKWLENFYKRFFAQQFKRSCLPDGVKVGSVSVSPRGDFMMPSDAYSRDLLLDLERVKP